MYKNKSTKKRIFCLSKPVIFKSTKDRTKVKSLKFPIYGVSKTLNDEFKTYGKFKKSEKFYDPKNFLQASWINY